MQTNSSFDNQDQTLDIKTPVHVPDLPDDDDCTSNNGIPNMPVNGQKIWPKIIASDLEMHNDML